VRSTPALMWFFGPGERDSISTKPEIDDEFPKCGRVLVEAECGTGFCDVLIESKDRTRAWFIEVKTDDEKASAGDVIRQLRWYASQRRGYEQKHLVCLAESATDVFRDLLTAGGVQLVKWEQFVLCDKALMGN